MLMVDVFLLQESTFSLTLLRCNPRLDAAGVEESYKSTHHNTLIVGKTVSA